MNKFLVLMISLSLVSCVSTSNINLAKDNDKVHLFYHYVNPKYPYEAIALLTGKFEIENNCLYWISKGGAKSTAVFPEYPKDVVKLDVKSNTLIYANHKIKIGKMFEVNGAIYIGYDRNFF